MCRRTVLLAAVAAAFLGLATASSAQQSPAINYVYDELNRLIGVVDQQGNASTFSYDPVGNILKIDRSDASGIPGPVGITLVSPSKGKIGTTVQIFGKGFSAVAGQNSVAFNGTLAIVTTAAPNRLVTAVPNGATTGRITVTTPLGSATSPTAFVVLGTLTVTPATARVGPTRTQQFEAIEAGTPTTNVRWAVNGITGGESAIGTISEAGLYTAPATVPVPATVEITATHRDDSTLSATATVTLVPPVPVFLAARGVSVLVASPQVVDKNVRAAVSVRVDDNVTRFSSAGPVSVQVNQDVTGFAAARAVAVGVEPVIITVAPATGALGSSLTMTLTGSGFSGATGISFLLNNAADPNITVANLTVSPDGTQATLDVTIAAGAVTGGRVVQIATPGGSSTRVGTGGNVFTVQ